MKKNNPEKLATQGTQDEEKHRETGNIEYTRQRKTIQRNWQHRVHKMKKNKTKNTTQYVLGTTMRKQTQITYIRHEKSYKQLEIKQNQTPFLCGNCNALDTRHRKIDMGNILHKTQKDRHR